MATQSERREATIAALDRAARQLFETRGFADTTVDDIAANAGVAKGAFYHHYESKEAIFTKVLEGVQLTVAREVAAIASKSADPVNRLRVGLRVYIQACERPNVRRVLLIDGPTVLGWIRWRKIDDQFFGEMTRRTVAAALGSNAAATHIQAVASLIAGAFAEAAMVGAADSKLKSRDLMAAMDLLLKGLESPAAKRRTTRRRSKH
jgi:AcrR family transcriptional regulator